jgi:hypothetical protein
MPDFHPTSEVIYLFPSFFNHAPLYWSGFCHFLQDIVPAPLARTISYNIEGPISALGYQPLLWLNWCLDMPHWIQLSSVQLLTKGKPHPWLLLQLPRRKEQARNYSFRSETFPSWT